MGFDIDEAIDEQNWKKESSVSLRFTSENDLDEIFNLIQTVGKEMECKDNELFAYSKNPATYLQMLKTGVAQYDIDATGCIEIVDKSTEEPLLHYEGGTWSEVTL